MKKLISVLGALFLCGAPATADTLSFYHHYCGTAARLDYDPDKDTMTVTSIPSGKTEVYKPQSLTYREPDLILVGPKGQRDKLIFYWGSRLSQVLIFREKVLWSCPK